MTERIPTKPVIAGLRKRFKNGTRVFIENDITVVDKSTDKFVDIKAGQQGTVRDIDDNGVMYIELDNDIEYAMRYGTNRACRVEYGDTDAIIETLNWIGYHQDIYDTGTLDMPCPRCGKTYLTDVRNCATSRYAKIYICSECGMHEALEVAGLAKKLSVRDWHCITNN